jgi:hypothetical protein
LHQKYQKPVFLPYIAVASGVWFDEDQDGEIDNEEFDPDGWNDKIVNVYKNLKKKRPVLLENGLFGYAPMELFDHPRHDYGGFQYFMRNEYHLGIINTDAIDETDEHLLGKLEPKGDVLGEIF